MQSLKFSDTYLLTLKLDRTSFERLQDWRTAYFPPARNLVPAHLTLFHTLDIEQVTRLREAWTAFATHAPVELEFTTPRLLGNGVAIDVRSMELGLLREFLVAAIAGNLSRQDQQRFRAHVTIQNKAPSVDAKVLYETLAAGFIPWSGKGTGLLIWAYLGGPWALQSELAFISTS